MSDGDHQDDGVVWLETRQQRTEREEKEYRDAVQREAIGMLERALGMVRDRRVAGVAIVFAFEDRSYGRILPELTSNMGALIGAVATAQHDLILSTLVPETPDV